MLPLPARLVLRPMVLCLLTFLAVGCGDSSRVTTVSVTGQITADGQPLQAENATVVFKRSKANPLLDEPYSGVDEKGRYTLGAEPGRYKVIVVAFEAPAKERRPILAPAKNYRLLVNPKYFD